MQVFEEGGLTIAEGLWHKLSTRPLSSFDYWELSLNALRQLRKLGYSILLLLILYVVILCMCLFLSDEKYRQIDAAFGDLW